MPIELRTATVEDAPKMAAVACAAWRYAYRDFLPEAFIDSIATPNLFTERILEGMKHIGERVVAMNELGAVIGFANGRCPGSLEGYDAEIGGLYVHPEAAHTGVGRMLVAEMVRRFMESGCHSMAIHTLEGNHIGSAFYEKIGGIRGPDAVWEGYPSKWYVWPHLPGPFSIND